MLTFLVLAVTAGVAFGGALYLLDGESLLWAIIAGVSFGVVWTRLALPRLRRRG